MQVFNLLERYIGKIILINILMTIFVLISLSSIIKFIDQLKKVGQGNYDITGAGIYTLLSIPKDVYIFFPMAALIGGLLGLGILAQYSELIVMQASGFTRMQIVLSVMKTAIPLIFLTMSIGEWIAPQSEQIARNYRAQKMYNGSLISLHQGVWVKDGNSFIYIECIKKSNELGGVNIYTFNHNHHLQSVRYAVSAWFDTDKKLWYLSQIDESNFQSLKQINNSQIVSDIWKTKLTPDKLGIIALDPDILPIISLYKYVKYLEFNGLEVGRYQLNMWSKIFRPVSVVVMILMAISFIFGSLRNVSMGIRLITGVSFSFIFYIFDQTFGSLILVYSISPIIGVILPSIIFFLISLKLLSKNF